MKTDRELLELAAKAAGMDYLIWTPGAAPIVPAAHRALHDRVCWHPLSDDGDALRLAVRLRITPDFNPRASSCIFTGYEVVNSGSRRSYNNPIIEKFGTDDLAATRRAIVRAAAAIWEAMP